MLILVTGATGNVGRHVVRGLLDAGVRVRALTRRPETADLPIGAETVRGDLREPETVRAALRGADRLYLFPVEGTAEEVVEAAREAGVGRVVVLSSVSAGYGESDLSGDHHRAVELAAERSGLRWTHVRPGEFMANLLDWAPAIAAEGVVRAPFADQESNAVHEADVADVAVTALLRDGHAGRAYEVNGPETLTREEQVRAIGRALGRQLRFEELTRAQAREQWIAGGMDAEVADWLLAPEDPEDAEHELGDEPPEPEPEVEPTAEAVTGNPARTLAQWAHDHREAFTTER